MLTIRDKPTLDQAVEALKFLSDGNRLRILAALAESETCVCDLIDELDLSQTLVSYHLAKLRKAGLVRSRREAQWVYYSLDPEAWENLIAPLDGIMTRRSLPPAAAYGTNHRCDVVPPDPTRGACSCGNGHDASSNGRQASKSAVLGADALLSPDVLDRLTDEVASRLLTRLLDRPLGD
jgi:DNA-binding transcriptional ArsR family regulator